MQRGLPGHGAHGGTPNVGPDLHLKIRSVRSPESESKAPEGSDIASEGRGKWLAG
jgi:hypothetical protein